MSSIAPFISSAVKADPSLSSDAKLVAETEVLAADLAKLDARLTPVTYLSGEQPSDADVALYCRLHPAIAAAPASQHPTYPSVLRYFLHVQSLAPVRAAQHEHPNAYPPLDVDVASLPAPARAAPAPKVKKDKKGDAAKGEGKAEGVVAQATGAVAGAAGAAAAVAGQAAEAVKEAVVGKADKKDKGDKKEKKEKTPKAPKAPAPEPSGPLPSMIDMRVGKVLDVKRHPDADSLYVESIDVGEPEPRQVCSGLVKYMTEDEIRGATIIVICNLKPVAMRGVKSFAMLLCASSPDGKDGGVEFVLPPPGAQPGDRIYFEGEKYENTTPEPQLNPKKKVFETIQPGFTTLDNLEAAWVDPETKSVHRIRTKDGVCKAKSFKGASLS
ncbi:G4 quadruplex nucleic acid binding protein [Cryptotrichosporon argae]